jgi:CRISPR-associated protein Csx10
MNIYLKLKNLSPLSVNLTRASSNIETLDYITGSSLRGAIANYYLDNIGSNTDEMFKKLFTEDIVYYPNLYPEKDTIGYWLPATARTCKRCKGFKCKEDPDKNHGVKDILFYQHTIKKQLTDEDKILPESLLDREKCPVCQEPLADYRVFYEEFNENRGDIEYKYKSLKVKKRLIPGTGINRYTGNVEENIFYTQEVIEENQFFSGFLTVKNREAGDYILDKIKPDMNLSFGSGKSRGFGKTEVLNCEEKDSNISQLKERLNKFNDVFTDYCKKENVSSNSEIYFSIDLLSHAVIQDRFLRYKNFIDEKDLARFTSLDENKLKLLHNVSSYELVSGWNMATGLPKEDNFVIEKGSVFLFSYDGYREELIKELEKLELNGIGLRKSEGFGKFMVCNPIHREVPL